LGGGGGSVVLQDINMSAQLIIRKTQIPILIIYSLEKDQCLFSITLRVYRVRSKTLITKTIVLKLTAFTPDNQLKKK